MNTAHISECDNLLALRLVDCSMLIRRGYHTFFKSYFYIFSVFIDFPRILRLSASISAISTSTAESHLTPQLAVTVDDEFGGGEFFL